jgi:aerobic C4-dicarboxylate transport protein
VLIGMMAGAALGVAAPGAGAAMQPLGDAFIKAIRALIAPIIFVTVAHGVAKMADMARVGRVALKALVYFEAVTTVALMFGLAAVNLWRPGEGMHIDLAKVDVSSISGYVAHGRGAVAFLLDIIPKTFLGAFADGNVLQVLLLAVLCGFALARLGQRARLVADFIEQAGRVMFVLVEVVMWTAPLGAFGAMAFTVGKFGVGPLLALAKLVLGFYVVCLIFVAVVFGAIARAAGLRLWPLIRYIREELLIVFATTSSETVLPRLMEKLERAGCEEGVVGLVVPAGYSFNLDGTCLYLSVAAVFLAQATDTPLGLSQQIGLLLVLLLSSKGAAGVAGAAFVVLAATLGATGSIPVASVALLLGAHRLLSEGLTPTNLIGNALATLVVAKWEGALDEARLNQALEISPRTQEILA